MIELPLNCTKIDTFGPIISLARVFLTLGVSELSILKNANVKGRNLDRQTSHLLGMTSNSPAKILCHMHIPSCNGQLGSAIVSLDAVLCK